MYLYKWKQLLTKPIFLWLIMLEIIESLKHIVKVHFHDGLFPHAN